MQQYLKYVILIFSIYLNACKSEKKATIPIVSTIKKEVKDTIISDCNYTFRDAIAGSNAPEEIISQLELIDVLYYSIDNKLHKGQVLTNKSISEDIKTIFNEMFDQKFHVAHAIPVVKYGWNDELSMENNNTYSFCYRNASFSKHATGMAIDINPFFNPVRWKRGLENRINKPEGASRDTTINGTFYSSHPVIKEFRRLGFFWGHNFKTKFDDHHFEK